MKIFSKLFAIITVFLLSCPQLHCDDLWKYFFGPPALELESVEAYKQAKEELASLQKEFDKPLEAFFARVEYRMPADYNEHKIMIALFKTKCTQNKQSMCKEDFFDYYFRLDTKKNPYDENNNKALYLNQLKFLAESEVLDEKIKTVENKEKIPASDIQDAIGKASWFHAKLIPKKIQAKAELDTKELEWLKSQRTEAKKKLIALLPANTACTTESDIEKLEEAVSVAHTTLVEEIQKIIDPNTQVVLQFIHKKIQQFSRQIQDFEKKHRFNNMAIN